MAILGGGPGGGGPLGSSNSFTGASTSIELVGNHFYIIPGLFPSSTTVTTVAEFTSGNYYCVGELYLHAGIPTAANISDVDQAACYISFNDSQILLVTTGGAAIDAAPWAKSALVIPPYTKVKIEMVCEETDGNSLASKRVVGRTYRG